jgi:hypothetical protein
MSRLRTRHSVVLAALSLASSLVVGCHQDLGERCEQNSDCGSGLCSGTGAANPGICTTGVISGGQTDAATDAPLSSDGASEASDIRSDVGSDLPSDVRSEVLPLEGDTETHVEAGETSEAGASSEAGAEAGGTDAAGEAGD